MVPHTRRSLSHTCPQASGIPKSLLRLFLGILNCIDGKHWSAQNLNFCRDWCLRVTLHQSLGLWYWGMLVCLWTSIEQKQRRTDYWSSTWMSLGHSVEWKRSVLRGHTLTFYLVTWKRPAFSDGRYTRGVSRGRGEGKWGTILVGWHRAALWGWRCAVMLLLHSSHRWQYDIDVYLHARPPSVPWSYYGLYFCEL